MLHGLKQMGKTPEPRNGRITPDTAISLKLVCGLIVVVCVVLGCWYDLKGEIKGVHHRIDLIHGRAMAVGTN